MRPATLGRRAEAVAALAAVRLPQAVIWRLVGGPVRADGSTLDPSTAMLLWLIARAGYPPPNELPVPEARRLYCERMELLAPPAIAMEEVVDRLIDGPVRQIPVRLYVPTGVARGEGLLVYYHGGGWVIGDLETHDRVCRRLAAEAHCRVLAVDYRLAPEHRFPAAVEDAVAAFRWAVSAADGLGVDRRRIAVGGDSAGGNLAAVVAQRARGEEARPCFQLLIYPVTDLRLNTRSHELFADGFMLTRALMEWFREHYLGDTGDVNDPAVSPLLCEDLAGLPPALVATAGFDPLRDEGRAYAAKLREARVAAKHRCYGDLIHGFFSMSGAIPAASLAARDIARELRRALHASP